MQIKRRVSAPQAGQRFCRKLADALIRILRRSHEPRNGILTRRCRESGRRRREAAQRHRRPRRPRDLGVKPEQLRGLAEKTFGIKRILRVKPRSVSVEEVEGIFNEAY
jgi:alcohol dehydrogenase class IV